MNQYKLTANIPGVNVILTRDPARARIEMTESAQRELVYIHAIYIVQNVVHGASFHLDKKNWPKFYKPEDAFEELNSFITRWYKLEEEKHDDQITKHKKIFHGDDLYERINEPHNGDCTAVPCSCTRCHLEELIGLNTLPYGKMINSRLERLAFKHYATDEERAADAKWKAEVKEKYGYTTEESTAKYWLEHPEEKAKHQVRWDEEDRLALIAFDLHQKMYEEQEKNNVVDC